MLRQSGRTPTFRDSEGKAISGSVAECGFLRLGGLDQWVLIRGRSIANPLLIVLHGGPGSPETALFRADNAALEDHYTVIHWEQRGAGRSFHRSIDPASMTVAQFVADLDELVDALRARFGVRQVALLGHSWGSMLGVHYAARHPQKVSAYIGVGQVADMARSEAASYAFVLAEAERRERRAALKALQAIGPPPYADLRALGVQRRWLTRLGGATGPGISLSRMIWRALATPETSPLDLVRLLRGSLFSLRCLEGELMGADLARQFPCLEVPVFFILGRHDHQVEAAVSADFFEALEAPHKQLFWLEQSGHFAPFEEPEAFNRLLIETVRPAAALGAQP